MKVKYLWWLLPIAGIYLISFMFNIISIYLGDTWYAMATSVVVAMFAVFGMMASIIIALVKSCE
tara:strand:+ start:487 stop:678 length:192 start_codon:yes stop_codon:yes gene_type:complete